MDSEQRLKEEALKDRDKPPLITFFLVESFKWGMLALVVFIFGRILYSFFTSEFDNQPSSIQEQSE